MLILGLFLGICSGFYVPAGMSLINDYFPEKERTKAFSLVAIGIILGMSLNQMTGTFITLWGWRGYYIYLGLLFSAFGTRLLHIFAAEV